jgi:transcriptional regulator with XRE-family HTH domain
MAKIVALVFDLSYPDQLSQYFGVLMYRKKVNLEELSRGVQSSKSLVSSALNGKKQSPRLVKALANYFGEDPENFFEEKKGDAQP